MTHNLYTNSDFTSEEYYEGSPLAKMVIDGGLGICKTCGAGEIQLEQFPDCASYFAHNHVLRDRNDVLYNRDELNLVDLQTILSGADMSRPLVLMPRALDRLVLRVDEPGHVCVVVPSKVLRERLKTVERNPSGVTVLTHMQAALDGGFPKQHVVFLGVGPLGTLNAKTYKLARNSKHHSARSVWCIADGLPPPLKRWALASALGQARRIFGGYGDFVAQFVETIPVRGMDIPKRMTPDNQAITSLKMMAMCDTRFAPLPETPKAESVDRNPPDVVMCVEMRIGDIVERKDGQFLRSGGEAYRDAIIVAVDPLVLVSRATDMRWQASVQNVPFRVVGTAAPELLKKCRRRLVCGYGGQPNPSRKE